MAEVDGTESVPTWRDGVILTSEEKDQLTAEQWRQYTDDSVIRDLSDIDQLPEPARSWAQGAVDRARAHAEARIAEQEHREAS